MIRQFAVYYWANYRLSVEGLLQRSEFTPQTAHKGDELLVSASSLLLRIPSAVVPHSYNYLFNLRHVAAGDAQIISARPHLFDKRILI